MSKLFLSTILMFCVSTAFAQKSTFGIVGNTVPVGYGLVGHDNVLAYFKEYKSTGAFCDIFIYKHIKFRI